MSECSHRQKTPRPRHTRNLNAILHSAYQVFRERGRAAATLAEVAALSGIEEEGIRHYFSDIDALLAAVIERWCDRLLGDARHRLESIEPPRERLQLLLQCYLDAIRREPQFCGRMLSEAGCSGYRAVPLPFGPGAVAAAGAGPRSHRTGPVESAGPARRARTPCRRRADRCRALRCR
jgi:AcrR family transcriptional regulator